MRNNPLLKTLLRRGFIVGVSSSIVGCIVFIVFEEIRMTILIQHKIDLQISFFIFLLGVAIAFFPAGGGGMLLTYILYCAAIKKKLSFSKSLLIGSFIGGTAGFLIMIVGGFLANWRGSASLFLFHAFEVMLLSAFAGCVTAIRISKYISQIGDSET